MKKHILLIEDERQEVGIFVQALNETQLSYKCTYAKDCTHALKMLDYLLPDYIFIDQNNYCTICFDGLRSIRKKQKLRSVPVVLFSCSMTKEIEDQASCLGVNYCYMKPSGIEDLSILLAGIILSDPKNGEKRNPSVKTPG